MEMDLIRIAVAVEIAPEHTHSRWRPQLRQLSLGEPAPPRHRGGRLRLQRKTVELRQILQIARLMRARRPPSRRDGRQNSNCNTTHFIVRPGSEPYGMAQV